MTDILLWLDHNKWLISSLTALSLLLLAITVLATPWLVAQLPADYLSVKKAPNHKFGPLRMLISVTKCSLGHILVLLGLLMIVTPGPGLVVFLLGIAIAEFPGKYRLLCYVTTRPQVFESLNWMRKRHHQPPFDHPQATLRP